MPGVVAALLYYTELFDIKVIFINISERSFIVKNKRFQKNTKKGLTKRNKDCIVFLSNQYENRENEKFH